MTLPRRLSSVAITALWPFESSSPREVTTRSSVCVANRWLQRISPSRSETATNSGSLERDMTGAGTTCTVSREPSPSRSPKTAAGIARAKRSASDERSVSQITRPSRPETRARWGAPPPIVLSGAAPGAANGLLCRTIRSGEPCGSTLRTSMDSIDEYPFD